MRAVIGIDEVGRGAWAGPLVVGAVLLRKPITGLKDSKQLTKVQRQKLDYLIRQSAEYMGLGWVGPAEVDSLGLTKALTLACKRAIEHAPAGYDIVIDGNINFLKDVPRTSSLIKGDQLIPSIAAASIVAKVARDEYMSKLSEKYPGYGFAEHVGYGTAKHSYALNEIGVSNIHRLSFKPVQAVL